MIEKKEVEKLAFLARIDLTEEEKRKVPGELEDILDYIQKLSNVRTEETEPLFHFPELKNVVREDRVEECEKEEREKMMNMGNGKDGYLKVESIL